MVVVRTKVGQWVKRHGINVALLVALALVALIVPTGLAGAQATPIDPTLANIQQGVEDLQMWQYITAGFFLALVVFLGLRLLRAKRA